MQHFLERPPKSESAELGTSGPKSPPKNFFQSWLCSGGPSTRAGRGANSRPGRVGGAGACAPWRGARAAGTAAPRSRRARCAQCRARQTGGRGASPSVRLSARSPLWASSAGCELRLLRLLFATRLEGGPFFSPFLRVCVCVCAQNISISGMKDGRWRPEGSPQGGSGGGCGRAGRQAGCSRRQEEKLPPFQLFRPL